MDTSYLDVQPEPKLNALIRLRYCSMCEGDTAQEKKEGEVTGGYNFSYWECRSCGNQIDFQPGDRPGGFDDEENR